jgi:hypothetical protein
MNPLTTVKFTLGIYKAKGVNHHINMKKKVDIKVITFSITSLKILLKPLEMSFSFPSLSQALFNLAVRMVK